MIGTAFLLAAAVAFEQPHVVPTPAKADWQLDQCVELKPELRVSMGVVDSRQREACADWFRRHAKEAFGVDWTIASRTRPGGLKDEEYVLHVSASNITVGAAGMAGVRYAFQTLRQIAMPKRGTLKVEGWIAPGCTITDGPKMKFRGIHLCWFPETKVSTLERCIRLAGYYKMNTVVLETWGTFRSEK